MASLLSCELELTLAILQLILKLTAPATVSIRSHPRNTAGAETKGTICPVPNSQQPFSRGPLTSPLPHIDSDILFVYFLRSCDLWLSVDQLVLLKYLLDTVPSKIVGIWPYFSKYQSSTHFLRECRFETPRFTSEAFSPQVADVCG